MINLRLKTERERLNLTQGKIAEATETNLRTVQNWEKGSSFPNAKQLSDMADLGLDISFIVQGGVVVRSTEDLYSEEHIMQGIKDYLCSTNELGWLHKPEDVDFDTVVNFALFHIKKASGDKITFRELDQILRQAAGRKSLLGG